MYIYHRAVMRYSHLHNTSQGFKHFLNIYIGKQRMWISLFLHWLTISKVCTSLLKITLQMFLKAKPIASPARFRSQYRNSQLQRLAKISLLNGLYCLLLAKEYLKHMQWRSLAKTKIPGVTGKSALEIKEMWQLTSDAVSHWSIFSRTSSALLLNEPQEN